VTAVGGERTGPSHRRVVYPADAHGRVVVSTTNAELTAASLSCRGAVGWPAAREKFYGRETV
jgi:hypothetical protein